MKVNIHYARQIAAGVQWHYTATFYHLHITVLLPWMSVEVGMFKKRGVKARRLTREN